MVNLMQTMWTVQRDELRENTAYPFLRKFGTFMIGLSVACAALLWLVVFYIAFNSVEVIPTIQAASVIPWLIAAVVSTLSIFATIYFNGIAQAIIDLADLHLRRE